MTTKLEGEGLPFTEYLVKPHLQSSPEAHAVEEVVLGQLGPALCGAGRQADVGDENVAIANQIILLFFIY